MLSAGEILKKARREKGLELAEISQGLKIQVRFLAALENGDWQAFDSPAHIYGFLKNYAAYLNLNTEEVLAFWRREYDPEKEEKKATRLPQPIALPRVVLTPALAVTSASLVFILLFLGYLGFRYRAFAGPPELEVSNPAQDLTLREKHLEVCGKTNQDAALTLNGQRIILNEDGSFSTPLSLNEGLNVLNFVAANKLGRQRKVTRRVTVLVGEPRVAGESTVETSPAATPSGYLSDE